MLKKDYLSAIDWLLKAIERDKEYLPPHKNISDIFDILKYTDLEIEQLIKKYEILQDYFYY